jgi:hypothetical protein
MPVGIFFDLLRKKKVGPKRLLDRAIKAFFSGWRGLRRGG